MDGAELKFPWKGLETMLRHLGGDETIRSLERAMAKAGDLYEAEAVALAPHKYGYLENSSTVRTGRRGSGGIRTEIAFTANYAAQVHELRPDQRGEKTKAKPSTRFGEPGPKYLERVLRGMDFEDIIGKEFRTVLKEVAASGRLRTGGS